MHLILGTNGTGIMKWYVDGSYGVHPNMRGHSGGGLTMGRGFQVTDLRKHKLNTRRSTESEVVRVDDFMPGIIWTRTCMKAKDYDVL